MKKYGKLADIVEAVYQDMRPHFGTGRVADYIPALARVDGRHFGIAIATCEGEEAMAGDAGMPFSIQSVSKVFTLTMALARVGAPLWHRVGREPSGSPFNSIVQLEHEQGIPRNPLINAGALVITDILTASRPPGGRHCRDRRFHAGPRRRFHSFDRSRRRQFGSGDRLPQHQPGQFHPLLR